MKKSAVATALLAIGAWALTPAHAQECTGDALQLWQGNGSCNEQGGPTDTDIPLAGTIINALKNLGLGSFSPGSKVGSDSRFSIEDNDGSSATVTTAGGKGYVAPFNLIGGLEVLSSVDVNAIGFDAMAIDRSSINILRNKVEGFVSAIGGAPTGSDMVRVNAIGGGASANSVLITGSTSRKTLADSRISVNDNTAKNVQSYGGKITVWASLIASGQVSGRATANGVVVNESDMRHMRIENTGNTASDLTSAGGAALANAVSLAHSDVDDVVITQKGNTAHNVSGGGGTLGAGFSTIAEIGAWGVATANAFTAAHSKIHGARITQERNEAGGDHASGVFAIGGTALANSVNFANYQGADLRQFQVTQSGNKASEIQAYGGQVEVVLGALADVRVSATALANSVSAQRGNIEGSARYVLTNNEAQSVRAQGGGAAANSIWLQDATVRDTDVSLTDNRAIDVRTRGVQASAVGGYLAEFERVGLVLVNSLGVFGSQLRSAPIVMADNAAADLSAEGGGVLYANSVGVEKGAGRASELAARVTMKDNSAYTVSTGATRVSGPVNIASHASQARAAVNAVVLKDGVSIDSASPVSLADNAAAQVEADGGTALVNALAAYRGARLTGSPVTLRDNTASEIRASGGSTQVMGIGRIGNGILLANGVYLDGGDQGAVHVSAAPVTISDNTARLLTADGGRLTVNGVAVNGQGRVDAVPVSITGNTAQSVKSEGNETTIAGYAAPWNGANGVASANALHVMGTLRAGSLELAGNHATDVQGISGVAVANSVVIAAGASADGMSATISGNHATGVRADSGGTAAVNSIYNEGKIVATSITISGNRSDAVQANGGDTTVNSVRNRKGAQLAASNITIIGNTGGQVAQSGTVNSLDNHGRIVSSDIMIAGNHGTASGGGVINSVVNRGGGSIIGGNVYIVGNRGSAEGDGSIANSVDNHGKLIGRVMISGNSGTATGGGIANSVVNKGVLTGNVLIAGNTGGAGWGAVANSVINRGVITGAVTIVGSQTQAGWFQTGGSVLVGLGGALVGAGGVVGNAPVIANPGYTTTSSGFGLIYRTVTVEPGVNTMIL